eukprot:Nk52_evm16s242 gene=Nk52_evmTU16s242
MWGENGGRNLCHTCSKQELVSYGYELAESLGVVLTSPDNYVVHSPFLVNMVETATNRSMDSVLNALKGARCAQSLAMEKFGSKGNMNISFQLIVANDFGDVMSMDRAYEYFTYLNSSYVIVFQNSIDQTFSFLQEFSKSCRKAVISLGSTRKAGQTRTDAPVNRAFYFDSLSTELDEVFLMVLFLKHLDYADVTILDSSDNSFPIRTLNDPRLRNFQVRVSVRIDERTDNMTCEEHVGRIIKYASPIVIVYLPTDIATSVLNCLAALTSPSDKLFNGLFLFSTESFAALQQLPKSSPHFYGSIGFGNDMLRCYHSEYARPYFESFNITKDGLVSSSFDTYVSATSFDVHYSLFEALGNHILQFGRYPNDTELFQALMAIKTCGASGYFEVDHVGYRKPSYGIYNYVPGNVRNWTNLFNVGDKPSHMYYTGKEPVLRPIAWFRGDSASAVRSNWLDQLNLTVLNSIYFHDGKILAKQDWSAPVADSRRSPCVPNPYHCDDDCQHGYCSKNNVCICDDDYTGCDCSLLKWTPTDSTIATTFYVIAGFFAALCIVVTVMIYAYREHPVIKSSSAPFCIVMAIGFLLGYLTLTLYFGKPTPNLCMARACFAAISFILIFSSLLAKTYRIARIFSNPTKANVELTNLFVFKITGALTVAQVVIMMIWFLLDRAEVKTFAINACDTIYYCSYNNNAAGLTMTVVFFVYNCSLLLVSFLLAYYTRNVMDLYKESRMISFSTFNIILLIIFIYCLSSISGLESKTSAILVTSCVVALITFSFSALILSKFFYIFYRDKAPRGSLGSNGASEKVENEFYNPELNVNADGERYSRPHVERSHSAWGS